MKKNRVFADIDAYGTYARASALADFLELLAIQKQSMTRASLLDLIHDNSWTLRAAENFSIPGEDPSADDEGERVFNLIDERVAILGDRYPFKTDNAGRLTFKNKSPRCYLALLALTVAHAYKLRTPVSVTDTFESTVEDVVKRPGWYAINFAAVRKGKRFANALEASGNVLRLETTTETAPRNIYAQDENVDTIVHVPWCTVRKGRWTMIGQVTCAMSNEWETKMKEPSEERWRLLLGECTAPRVFLAVPHHAEPKHRLDLLSGLALQFSSIVFLSCPTKQRSFRVKRRL